MQNGITSTILSGLKAFLEDYPDSRAFFIYGGKRRLYKGNIGIVLIEEAIRNLKELLWIIR